MAEIITIDGVVGWDVTAESVKNQLDKAGGKEIEVQISSPGGSVFTGISVYNLIKNYGGEKSTKIIGLAASMGSYIALATDRVTVEENAVYMVHNASGFSWGDHRELRKSAKLLEGLSNLLGRKYEAKTGKSTEEITALMDDETWMFGQEIVDQGFADEVVKSETTTDEGREEALAFAKLRIEDCNAKLSTENQKEDLEKVAALLKIEPKAQKQTPTPKGAVKMTPEEIKALQDKLAAAEAKLAESEAAKVEPVVEVEPVIEPEAKTGIDKALAILQSANYPKNVKDIAAAVVKGDASESELNVMASAFDMVTELIASEKAKAESDKLDPTPGAIVKDTGVKDGKATTAEGVFALGEELKELNKESK